MLGLHGHYASPVANQRSAVTLQDGADKRFTPFIGQTLPGQDVQQERSRGSQGLFALHDEQLVSSLADQPDGR
eukprot:scaffold335136_cov14-Prasinocladus_malaysianus.AAC.1